MTANGTGPLADVIVRASNTSGDMAVIAAISGFQSPAMYYGCELMSPSAARAVPNTMAAPGKLVPDRPVTTDLVLRLIVNKPDATTNDVYCRADYGVSIATNVATTGNQYAGPAGVMVSGSLIVASPATVTIDAIAISVPLGTCPPTVFR